jgi:hypothetical protein
MDLGRFFIDELIVHDIPKRTGEGPSPTLSEIASDLDNALLNLFRERINRSLSRRYRAEVENNPDTDSPVPTYVWDVLGDAGQLVDASRGMATRLFESQPKISPEGLLVVGRGSVAGATAITICKLEREDGIRVRQTQRDGARTFSVNYLRDLMLGKNTKVFKAALFVGADGNRLEGLVSDDQSQYDESGTIATFWLSKFLGCQLRVEADVSTERFFNTTQDWLNTLSDADKRARYQIALLAEMNSTANSITPTAFATTHLQEEDRQPYRDYLADRSAPLSRFEKSVRLIEPRLSKMSVGYEESGLRLIGSPESMGAYVAFPEGETDGPTQIHDRVKRVRGGS